MPADNAAAGSWTAPRSERTNRGEPPLLQDLRQSRVLALECPVQPGIGAHDRSNVGLRHRRLERWQVSLIQRTGRDLRIERPPIGLLAVGDQVLGRRRERPGIGCPRCRRRPWLRRGTDPRRSPRRRGRSPARDRYSSSALGRRRCFDPELLLLRLGRNAVPTTGRSWAAIPRGAGSCVTPVSPNARPEGPSCSVSEGMHSRATPRFTSP